MTGGRGGAAVDGVPTVPGTLGGGVVISWTFGAVGGGFVPGVSAKGGDRVGLVG